ncbi:hypothetical protein NPIL_684331 [Nephila pilipes]|uniref:Uncharacterized protein n=1 Tax=Nephila pilipes TaxID=299642 RepID=A0A8X6NTQ6_NEPPI|nr:hypothetical protein NPIL_684331 [Nephila pilipes]
MVPNLLKVSPMQISNSGGFSSAGVLIKGAPICNDGEFALQTKQLALRRREWTLYFYHSYVVLHLDYLMYSILPASIALQASLHDHQILEDLENSTRTQSFAEPK